MISLEQFLEKLGGGHERNGSFMARCPAHEDRQASLSIRTGDKGGLILKCHAGCKAAEVVAKMGLRLADLCPPRKTTAEAKAAGEILAVYDYTDAAGTLIYQVVRKSPKKFLQRRPDGNGDYVWNLKGIQRELYRLPEVLEAIKKRKAIYVCEGEKDANLLHSQRLTATTNSGGAEKWHPDFSQTLQGAHVVILPDQDAAGSHHAQIVAQSLVGLAESIRVLVLPNLPEKGDVSDWFAAGGTKSELGRLARECPEWTPETPVTASETPETPPLTEDDLAHADADALEGEGNRGPSELTLARDWAKQVKGELAYFEGAQWYRYQAGQWLYSSTEHAKADLQHWLEKCRAQGMKVSVTAAKVRNILALACNHLGPHEPSELNAHPTWIPLRNGVYDTETAQVGPHSPEHFLTTLLPVEFDAGAVCPRWMQFLQETLITLDGAPCEEWIGALQEWFGYCLVPDNRGQVSLVWVGEGRNGKGVAARALEALIGRGQYTAVPIEQLHDPYHRAELQSKLVGFVNEPEARVMAKNGSHFKAIVGGDLISARRPHENVFSFVPYCRLVISCNDIPSTRDLSSGYFRRIIILEWRRQFSAAEADPDLDAKLLAELPGIFNWAAAGLRRFRERGNKFPVLAESDRLLTAYRLGEDPLSQFIQEECLVGPEARCWVADFYAGYRAWMLSGGFGRPDSKAAIGKRLDRLGYKSELGRQGERVGRVRKALGLRPSSAFHPDQLHEAGTTPRFFD